MKIINWIIRGNKWYDSVPEPRRFFIFLLTFVPVIVMSILIKNPYFYIFYPSYLLVFVILRMVPAFVGIYNMHKKQDNK